MLSCQHLTYLYYISNLMIVEDVAFSVISVHFQHTILNMQPFFFSITGNEKYVKILYLYNFSLAFVVTRLNVFH